MSLWTLESISLNFLFYREGNVVQKSQTRIQILKNQADDRGEFRTRGWATQWLEVIWELKVFELFSKDGGCALIL